jgi:hypothetical protein
VLGRIKPSWASTFAGQAYGVDALASGFEERPVISQRSARDCGEHGGALYALTTPRWRYHLYAPGRELLFDRAADPHELHDRAGVSADSTLQLRQETIGLIAELKKRAEGHGGLDGVVPPVSAEILRQMEALGYAGGSSGEDEDEEESDAVEEDGMKPAATSQSATQPGHP